MSIALWSNELVVYPCIEVTISVVTTVVSGGRELSFGVATIPFNPEGSEGLKIHHITHRPLSPNLHDAFIICVCNRNCPFGEFVQGPIEVIRVVLDHVEDFLNLIDYRRLRRFPAVSVYCKATVHEFIFIDFEINVRVEHVPCSSYPFWATLLAFGINEFCED